MKRRLFLSRILLCSMVVLFYCCQNDDSPVSYDKGNNQYTNMWINEQMRKYYYWNEDLPVFTNLSIDPKDYLGKLLNTDDRFSYTLNPADSQTSPKSIRDAYGFDISFLEYNGQALGIVLFVLADSPAQRSGLKRGQLITSINGITIHHQNFENLYLDLASSGSAQLELTEYSSAAGFSEVKNIGLIRSFTFAHPVKHEVIVYNDQKAGYIEISHFDAGLAPTFLQIFKEFQQQSISKVIVDLRYNGGGDLSSVTALSIILAPNIKSDDIFIKLRGNKNGGLVNQTFKEALEMNESQLSFESLRTAHPPIQELYVLSGNHTASASEIILNNLKPFMNVISIGEKTAGKDAAGFAIEDNRLADKKGWVLCPVIYKLFNANDEGNYALGISPTAELNELQEIEIFPLGDVRETLLNQALNGEKNFRQKKHSTVTKLLLNKNCIDADPFLQIHL